MVARQFFLQDEFTQGQPIDCMHWLFFNFKQCGHLTLHPPPPPWLLKLEDSFTGSQSANIELNAILIEIRIITLGTA